MIGGDDVDSEHDGDDDDDDEDMSDDRSSNKMGEHRIIMFI